MVAVDQFRYDYLTRFRADYHAGFDRLISHGAVFTVLLSWLIKQFDVRNGGMRGQCMSSKHLIVGLGGTGGKIIRAFRKTIFQEFRKEDPDAVSPGFLS